MNSDNVFDASKIPPEEPAPPGVEPAEWEHQQKAAALADIFRTVSSYRQPEPIKLPHIVPLVQQLEPFHEELRRATRLTRIVVIQNALIVLLTAAVLTFGILVFLRH